MIEVTACPSDTVSGGDKIGPVVPYPPSTMVVVWPKLISTFSGSSSSKTTVGFYHVVRLVSSSSNTGGHQNLVQSTPSTPLEEAMD